MKKLFSDPAMRIQGIKIIILVILLIVPFTFHNAVAKKQPSEKSTSQAEKISKKNKKKKKTAVEETPNQLTLEEGRKLIHQKFEVPKSLQPAVDFWKKVYTEYDRRFEIFHDTENLSIIYSVLNFSDLYDNPNLLDDDRRAMRQERVEIEKDRIRNILIKLAEGYQAAELNQEERAIYDLFKEDFNPHKFKEAAEGRIRSQTGIQDKFMAGVINSGAYMEEIENIFTSYGLPVELTRLVFVESMFNTKARSKVGASGLWQFMPSTGRLYLNIDAIVDERNDPIAASHAAARLLKSNYEALGTWPLSINAYNSGRGTMQNAVRNMGTTNIEDIIQYYRGGVYGFASRNFYPSFLAALEVANHYKKYFGELERQAPARFEDYYLQKPTYLVELANAAGTNSEVITNLNSHFSDLIISNEKRIPAGYSIRIPKGTYPQFAQAEILLSGQTQLNSVDRNSKPQYNDLDTTNLEPVSKPVGQDL